MRGSPDSREWIAPQSCVALTVPWMRGVGRATSEVDADRRELAITASGAVVAFLDLVVVDRAERLEVLDDVERCRTCCASRTRDLVVDCQAMRRAAAWHRAATTVALDGSSSERAPVG